MPTLQHLPIDDILPDLRACLASGQCAVLHAPPGAGKTTRVPLALRHEPWLYGKRIVMLEPRRLAARSAARFMARQLGERIGETVGYRMRMDTRIGPGTRIEVVTEGVLTRMLQADPELTGIGCIIFDEFHERSLHADLGLALAIECRDALRDDLRLVVMSATLDSAPVAALLGGCPILTSQGRSFPVETVFLPPVRKDADVAEHVALAVRRALAEEDGSILAFLPGAAEIRRTGMLLSDIPAEVASVHQLYGTLAQSAQDAAIAPAAPGTRKVVLASAIAETSLTIEGIRVVVDGGLARVPRFDPGSGMTRLTTERVSRASADQRRGRAGRLGPGVCYRLWSAGEDSLLKAFPAPEIQEADLAPLALELALWGVTDPAAMAWLDTPPAGNMGQARDLLRSLGALDTADAVTPRGRAMAALPLHPRLSHMVLTARQIGHGRTACMMAALLTERDATPGGADLRRRMGNAVAAARTPANAPQWRTILESAARIARMTGVNPRERIDAEASGMVLGLAYPDRIAQRTGAGTFRLSCGRAAWLPEDDPLAHEEFLCVADLDGNASRARIWRAAPVLRDELESIFEGDIVDDTFVVWDARTEAVSARRQRQLRKLVLADAPLQSAALGDVSAAVVEGIRSIGLHCLPWDDATRDWRARVNFLRGLDTPDESPWPDVSDAALLAGLEDWLAPFLTGITRRSHFKRMDLAAALRSLLPWDMQRRLDREAPAHLTLPSGWRARIDYAPESGPVLLVKLQKMFGVLATPTIANGRYALTVHLLSPAGRPLQITRDLEGFWKNGYRAVKAEMKGRYPKHPWPDDPLA